MRRVVIVSARRTPQGRFLGALSKRSAVDLACAAGAAALTSIGADAVEQVIVGNVLSAGQGMNIARQIGVRLGVPLTSPAFTVNMMCASGMQAVALAAAAIGHGEADVILCGGTESMSNAPYALERARAGLKFGDAVLVDTMLRDGLVDSFDHQHMQASAERLARQYAITRAQQDAFAAESQRRCAAAEAAGRFRGEIVAVDGLERDEHPRPETTWEGLAKLKPAFDPAGTITAGNASGINDAAAMLVLCDEQTAETHGWQPLAAIEALAAVGCDPKLMGLGPVHATRRLCDQYGLQLADFDTIELNEAFASQSLACLAELRLDPARVNPDGGAIALGHPLGASGARLLVHLAHRIAAGSTCRGLATLCAGGGMGAAVSVVRC
jgi:acetyl-CoA C-acetyltransferase